MKVTQVIAPSRRIDSEGGILILPFKLYTYPIKSMREIPLTTAQVTPHGFPFDRRFMLFKLLPEGSQQPRRRMTVTNTPEMTLFHPQIDLRDGCDSAKGILTVTYSPPDGAESQHISLPLVPDISGLEIMDTALHASPTKAYNMGHRCNAWFSSCFGYEVILAYLGPNLRPIRGNLSPKLADGQGLSKNWLSSLVEMLPNYRTSRASGEEGITFADMAPYLIVTEESRNEVSTRLSEGMEVDMTKFRANIVVSGASTPYEEDYWAGLQIFPKGDNEHQMPNIELVLTQNCTRCVSLNIDYSTGKAGKGEAGSVLKKLMRDRRVDKSIKWSPVFGRYAFLDVGDGASRTIAVGDTVTISKRNQERTGLGNLALLLCLKRPC